MHQVIVLKWNPTRDVLQYMGFTTSGYTNDWASPRHQARFSAFSNLPYGFKLSGFYSFTQGPRSDILTGDYPLNASAPRVILSNGRSVADPFFNTAYPAARRRGVKMLDADNAHVVNMRLERAFTFSGDRRLVASLDVYNLFNSAAAFGFLSVDNRASTFGTKTNTLPARVAQMGVRFVF
jgi:hypothetical protein